MASDYAQAKAAAAERYQLLRGASQEDSVPVTVPAGAAGVGRSYLQHDHERSHSSVEIGLPPPAPAPHAPAVEQPRFAQAQLLAHPPPMSARGLVPGVVQHAQLQPSAPPPPLSNVVIPPPVGTQLGYQGQLAPFVASRPPGGGGPPPPPGAAFRFGGVHHTQTPTIFPPGCKFHHVVPQSHLMNAGPVAPTGTPHNLVFAGVGGAIPIVPRPAVETAAAPPGAAATVEESRVVRVPVMNAMQHMGPLPTVVEGPIDVATCATGVPAPSAAAFVNPAALDVPLLQREETGCGGEAGVPAGGQQNHLTQVRTIHAAGMRTAMAADVTGAADYTADGTNKEIGGAAPGSVVSPAKEEEAGPTSSPGVNLHDPHASMHTMSSNVMEHDQHQNPTDISDLIYYDSSSPEKEKLRPEQDHAPGEQRRGHRRLKRQNKTSIVHQLQEPSSASPEKRLRITRKAATDMGRVAGKKISPSAHAGQEQLPRIAEQQPRAEPVRRVRDQGAGANEVESTEDDPWELVPPQESQDENDPLLWSLDHLPVGGAEDRDDDASLQPGCRSNIDTLVNVGNICRNRMEQAYAATFKPKLKASDARIQKLWLEASLKNRLVREIAEWAPAGEGESDEAAEVVVDEAGERDYSAEFKIANARRLHMLLDLVASQGVAQDQDGSYNTLQHLSEVVAAADSRAWVRVSARVIAFALDRLPAAARQIAETAPAAPGITRPQLLPASPVRPDHVSAFAAGGGEINTTETANKPTTAAPAHQAASGSDHEPVPQEDDEGIVIPAAAAAGPWPGLLLPPPAPPAAMQFYSDSGGVGALVGLSTFEQGARGHEYYKHYVAEAEPQAGAGGVQQGDQQPVDNFVSDHDIPDELHHNINWPIQRDEVDRVPPEEEGFEINANALRPLTIVTSSGIAGSTSVSESATWLEKMHKAVDEQRQGRDDTQAGVPVPPTTSAINQTVVGGSFAGTAAITGASEMQRPVQEQAEGEQAGVELEVGAEDVEERQDSFQISSAEDAKPTLLSVWQVAPLSKKSSAEAEAGAAEDSSESPALQPQKLRIDAPETPDHAGAGAYSATFSPSQDVRRRVDLMGGGLHNSPTSPLRRPDVFEEAARHKYFASAEEWDDACPGFPPSCRFRTNSPTNVESRRQEKSPVYRQRRELATQEFYRRLLEGRKKHLLDEHCYRIAGNSVAPKHRTESAGAEIAELLEKDDSVTVSGDKIKKRSAAHDALNYPSRANNADSAIEETAERKMKETFAGVRDSKTEAGRSRQGQQGGLAGVNYPHAVADGDPPPRQRPNTTAVERLCSPRLARLALSPRRLRGLNEGEADESKEQEHRKFFRPHPRHLHHRKHDESGAAEAAGANATNAKIKRTNHTVDKQAKHSFFCNESQSAEEVQAAREDRHHRVPAASQSHSVLPASARPKIVGGTVTFASSPVANSKGKPLAGAFNNKKKGAAGVRTAGAGGGGAATATISAPSTALADAAKPPTGKQRRSTTSGATLTGGKTNGPSSSNISSTGAAAPTAATALPAAASSSKLRGNSARHANSYDTTSSAVFAKETSKQTNASSHRSFSSRGSSRIAAEGKGPRASAAEAKAYPPRQVEADDDGEDKESGRMSEPGERAERPSFTPHLGSAFVSDELVRQSYALQERIASVTKKSQEVRGNAQDLQQRHQSGHGVLSRQPSPASMRGSASAVQLLLSPAPGLRRGRPSTGGLAGDDKARVHLEAGLLCNGSVQDLRRNHAQLSHWIETKRNAREERGAGAQRGERLSEVTKQRKILTRASDEAKVNKNKCDDIALFYTEMNCADRSGSEKFGVVKENQLVASSCCTKAAQAPSAAASKKEVIRADRKQFMTAGPKPAEKK